MKRIATMQDISCAGKCSLTVALPVISSLGIECCVLPTAVLSTHTMFQGFTFHDLTSEINPIMHHWKNENFTFDALYTGYLGSIEQIEIAKNLFQTFGDHALKIIDPCMADNGKLYAGFTTEFAHNMKELCQYGDMICPNLTEASFLLDVPYQAEYDEQYIQSILHQLTDLGCNTAILTGVSLSENKTGAYAYQKDTDQYYYYQTTKEPKQFHGTGDLWASTFTGSIVKGYSIEQSLKISCEFVRESIHKTLEEENHNIYGVNFEEAIPYLIQLTTK